MKLTQLRKKLIVFGVLVVVVALSFAAPSLMAVALMLGLSAAWVLALCKFISAMVDLWWPRREGDDA